MGQLEAIPLPRLNGGYPFGNRAYAGPLRGYRIAPEADQGVRPDEIALI